MSNDKTWRELFSDCTLVLSVFGVLGIIFIVAAIVLAALLKKIEKGNCAG